VQDEEHGERIPVGLIGQCVVGDEAADAHLQILELVGPEPHRHAAALEHRVGAGFVELRTAVRDRTWSPRPQRRKNGRVG
jgi:hypothetical protein